MKPLVVAITILAAVTSMWVGIAFASFGTYVLEFFRRLLG